MVGTDRWRVIDWEKGAIPERRFRQRLAELSNGRHTEDDFTVDPQQRSAEVAAQIQEMNSRVQAVTRDVATDRQQIRELADELRALRADQVSEEQIIDEVLRRLREAS